MSKYTVVGDPHAKPDNLHKIEELFDIIESLGNKTIILGDLLDTKELVRGKCLNTYVRRLSSSNLEYIILVGNHDWFNLDCQEHSLEPLKAIPNVKVVDKPQELEEMVFLPYLPNYDSSFKRWCSRPLFCHMDMPGFDYGNGYISEHGLDPKILESFPNVISGHYHKYQKVKNITYLGTPFSHSFGESNQGKFIGVFDKNYNSLELIATPFPKHFTHEAALDDPKLKEFLGKLSQDVNHHRVILDLGGKSVKGIKLDYPGVKIIPKNFEVQSSPEFLSEKDSPEEQFESWAKKVRKLPQDTVRLGLELLKNV